MIRPLIFKAQKLQSDLDRNTNQLLHVCFLTVRHQNVQLLPTPTKENTAAFSDHNREASSCNIQHLILFRISAKQMFMVELTN